VPSFIARTLKVLEIYGEGTFCHPPLPGSETPKKPRQNRVLN